MLDLNLAEKVPGKPWQRLVAVARVPHQLSIPVRQLRGAVVAALELDGGAGVEWHQHGDTEGDGANANRPPVTYYRREEICLWGVTAIERAARLLGVRSLFVGGEVLESRLGPLSVTQSLAQYTSGGEWRRYELVTPMWPSETIRQRFGAAETEGERLAWAGQAITSAVTSMMSEFGIIDAGAAYALVRPGTLNVEPCQWMRPSREFNHKVGGIRCEFMVNAEIPSGLAIGRHRSEGFGELRRC